MQDILFTIPLGDKPCYQICLYFEVVPDLPAEGIASREGHVEFHWVSIEEMEAMTVYPAAAAALPAGSDTEVKHFIDR